MAKKEKAAAPVGIDQVHEVITERQERQEDKAKAAAAEAAKAKPAAAPSASPNPSCNVDAPRLSAMEHQKELARFRTNLAQRQLAELARKFPVVAALVKENAQLKKLKS